jgi:hypothetical protein
VKQTSLVVPLLAAWLGAGVLFSAVIAPAAFAVLPSRELAGALVGRVLPVIFIAGIVVSAAGLAFDRAVIGRGLRVRRWALVVVAIACAVAQFGVAPRIETVRREIGGPIEQLAHDDPRRLAFGRLHAVSVAWLGLAMVAAASVMVLASLAPRDGGIASM